MYNVVPTTPTYLEKFNDTKIGQNTSENATIFEMPENCTKCIKTCGFQCKNSCYANLECNSTNFDYYDDASNYTEISNETCENCALNYFDDPDQGNLLSGIVNWLCTALFVVQGPVPFSRFFSLFQPKTKKQFLQTMLAMYGVHLENK